MVATRATVPVVHPNVLNADYHSDGITKKVMTAEERTKLSGIEEGADVTDSTNVDAAGAVMNADTATTDMQFVGTGSDLSQDGGKLAKREDVKAYADPSFLAENNTWTPTFPNAVALPVSQALEEGYAIPEWFGADGVVSDSDRFEDMVAALDDASSEGGVCELGRKEYTLTRPLIVDKRGISIRGQGPGTWANAFPDAATPPPTKVTIDHDDGEGIRIKAMGCSLSEFAVEGSADRRLLSYDLQQPGIRVEAWDFDAGVSPTTQMRVAQRTKIERMRLAYHPGDGLLSVGDITESQFNDTDYAWNKGMGARFDAGDLPLGSTVNFTVTIASPAVVTSAGHGFTGGEILSFTTTGSLPTGLSTSTRYFVVNATTDTFQLAEAKGGAAVNTSGSQSGTHSYRRVLRADQHYAGLFTFSNNRIGNSGGNALAIANPFTTRQFNMGVRVYISNTDMYGNCRDSAVAYADPATSRMYDFWIFGEQIMMDLNAWSGLGTGLAPNQQGGLWIAGRDIDVNNSRFIDTQYPIRVGNLASQPTRGVWVRGFRLANTEAAVASTVVDIASGAEGVHVFNDFEQWSGASGSSILYTNLITSGTPGSEVSDRGLLARLTEVATVASGVLQIQSNTIDVRGEGAAADTIDTIQNERGSVPVDGTIITLTNRQAYDITIGHATGNIRTRSSGPVVLPTNGVAQLISNGTNWLEAGGAQSPRYFSTASTGGNVNVNGFAGGRFMRFTGTLTSDITATLVTTGAHAGDWVRLSRTGAGAFVVAVGSLINLAQDEWCEIVYSGSAWELVASGSL